MLTLTSATVLTVANAKLGVYVLPLTVLTTTLSFNVLTRFLTVANAKLSVYVLSLTVLTATLSFNMLPRY